MNLKALCCNPTPKIAETCNFLRIIDLAKGKDYLPPLPVTKNAPGVAGGTSAN